MLPRIKNDLNQFLNQYDLDVSTKIFEKSIPLLANLEITDTQKKAFLFAKEIDGVGCRFIAPRVDAVNKAKLREFFGIAIGERANKNYQMTRHSDWGSYSDDEDYADEMRKNNNEDSHEIINESAEEVDSEEELTDKSTEENSKSNEKSKDSDEERSEGQSYDPWEEENKYDYIYSFEVIYEISESHLKETILPLFKNFITTLHETNSDFFEDHQAKAKYAFERNALGEMKKSLALLETELVSNTEVVTQTELCITSRLFEAIKSLKHYDVYKYAELEEKLNTFNSILNDLENIQIRKNQEYADKIDHIIANLKIYLRVNPMKYYLSWKSIIDSLNSFLYDSRVNIHDCDIFEETLLSLSGIANTNRHCQFSQGRNASINFYIPDFPAEDADKLLQFFHESGAESAKIISACYKASEYDEIARSPSGELCFHRAYPSVSFNVSCVDIIEKILPLFYAKVNELKVTTSDIFPIYVKLCESRFRCMEIKMRENKENKSDTERTKTDVAETPAKANTAEPQEMNPQRAAISVATNPFSVFHHENNSTNDAATAELGSQKTNDSSETSAGMSPVSYQKK